MGNIFDLFGLGLNAFVLYYHVYDGHYLQNWIVVFAAVAMAIMWIQIFRMLVIYESYAFYLRLVTELMKDMAPFIILFAVTVFMFSNIFYIFHAELIYNAIKE